MEADAWYEVCRVTLYVMEDDCVGISDGIRVWSRHSERDTLPHPEEHLKIEHLTSESRHQSELILSIINDNHDISLHYVIERLTDKAFYSLGLSFFLTPKTYLLKQLQGVCDKGPGYCLSREPIRIQERKLVTNERLTAVSRSMLLI